MSQLKKLEFYEVKKKNYVSHFTSKSIVGFFMREEATRALMVRFKSDDDELFSESYLPNLQTYL